MISQLRQDESSKDNIVLPDSELGNPIMPNPNIDFYAGEETAPPVEEESNILNNGRQLSLMTECSDILDNSAEILFERFQEDSQASHKDEEDEYLTFQLCEGEEMNNEMANFIGIHMLNDGFVDGEEQDNKADAEGGLTYQCPKTGSHFEFMDLLGRIRNLKQKRNVIDDQIRQEDERQKKIRDQNKEQANRQKQIVKQKKLKTQVQNILKNVDNEDDGNDSMPQNIITTDEDVFILEDEDHLQSHHVTNDIRPDGKTQKPGGKIYNTHDGRQQ